MNGKLYSYAHEQDYYSRNWPKEALPYQHLEPYLTCWMDPGEMFGGKTVLDIGAGECTYTRLIADCFAPRQIVACELFPPRMWPAANANRNPRLEFVAGDAFSLPFADHAFDVVFGSLVLHQLPDLKGAIIEIKRVLSDSGVYVGIEPNPFNPIVLYRYFRGRHSRNQYLLSEKHLTLFNDFGFIVKVQYFYGRFPWIRNRLMSTIMGIIAQQTD